MSKIVKRKPKAVLKCEICNVNYKNRYKLNAHLYAIHKAVPPRFLCGYCDKGYFRSDEYQRHVSSHENITNNKQHICDHCGRSFVEKKNLIYHLKIHDDVPLEMHRHFCVFCPASFCEARLLHYHIKKLHLTEKKAGNVHFRKKVNEKWLEPVLNTKKCVEIKKIKNNALSIKGIRIRSDNGRHLQLKATLFAVNNKQYSNVICDYCGKGMLKKNLVKHIRERHLKLKMFRCDDCKRSFSRPYQLCDHKCMKT